MDDINLTDTEHLTSTENGEVSVRSCHRDGHLVVEAVGHVSLRTAGVLAAALNSDEAQAAPSLTVDLRQVDYLDNAGLMLLVQASKLLRSPGVGLAPRVLVTAGKQPARVLWLGQYRTIFEVIESAKEVIESAVIESSHGDAPT